MLFLLFDVFFLCFSGPRACCSPTAEGCASPWRVAVRRGGAAANCAVRRTAIIHMRQPNPRQERFRIKGGRSDGALKIGDLLIASKVPKASDLAKSRERPRNRFTAAVFGATFWPHKRLHKKKKMQFAELRGPQAAARIPATQKPPKITPPSGAPTPRYMKTQKASLARRLLY